MDTSPAWIVGALGQRQRTLGEVGDGHLGDDYTSPSDIEHAILSSFHAQRMGSDGDSEQLAVGCVSSAVNDGKQARQRSVGQSELRFGEEGRLNGRIHPLGDQALNPFCASWPSRHVVAQLQYGVR